MQILGASRLCDLGAMVGYSVIGYAALWFHNCILHSLPTLRTRYRSHHTCHDTCQHLTKPRGRLLHVPLHLQQTSVRYRTPSCSSLGMHTVSSPRLMTQFPGAQRKHQFNAFSSFFSIADVSVSLCGSSTFHVSQVVTSSDRRRTSTTVSSRLMTQFPGAHRRHQLSSFSSFFSRDSVGAYDKPRHTRL